MSEDQTEQNNLDAWMKYQDQQSVKNFPESIELKKAPKTTQKAGKS